MSSNPWNNDVFDSAWEKMQSTWSSFALMLGTLHLLLLIDVLSGSQFMKDGGGIEIGDFKVVRETLSITYGLLFTLFISKALLESRVVKDMCASEANGSISAVKTKAVLWTLSPFSSCRRMQKLFWLLLIDGFAMLALFTVIHLFDIREFKFLPKIMEPVPLEEPAKAGSDPASPKKAGQPGERAQRIIKPVYVGIGVVDLVLLGLCLHRGREIVENLRFIRAKFTPACSTRHNATGSCVSDPSGTANESSRDQDTE